MSYDVNGGTGDVPATSGYYLEGELYTVADVVLSRDGYTFKGWKLGEMTYQAGKEFDMPGENVTLVANWEANTYEVTFNVKMDGLTSSTASTRPSRKTPARTATSSSAGSKKAWQKRLISTPRSRRTPP